MPESSPPAPSRKVRSSLAGYPPVFMLLEFMGGSIRSCQT
jgi:hypothetical protein